MLTTLQSAEESISDRPDVEIQEESVRPVRIELNPCTINEFE
jgi:hypothetical protein